MNEVSEVSDLGGPQGCTEVSEGVSVDDVSTSAGV